MADLGAQPGADHPRLAAVPRRPAPGRPRARRGRADLAGATPRRDGRGGAPRGPAQRRLRRRPGLAAAVPVRRRAAARGPHRRGPPYPPDGHRRPGGIHYGGHDHPQRAFTTELPAPPGEATRIDFGADDLCTLRGVVRRLVAAARLDQDAGDDLVLAAHELAMNSVQHGGGSGTLLTWQDAGRAGRGGAGHRHHRRPADRPHDAGLRRGLGPRASGWRTSCAAWSRSAPGDEGHPGPAAQLALAAEHSPGTPPRNESCPDRDAAGARSGAPRTGRRQTCASGTTRSWRSELRLVSLAKSTATIVITEAIAT